LGGGAIKENGVNKGGHHNRDPINSSLIKLGGLENIVEIIPI